jgi:hypothetical protein
VTGRERDATRPKQPGRIGWAAAGGSLLAAAIGIVGVPAAASASTPSPVVGYT